MYFFKILWGWITATRLSSDLSAQCVKLLNISFCSEQQRNVNV